MNNLICQMSSQNIKRLFSSKKPLANEKKAPSSQAEKKIYNGVQGVKMESKRDSSGKKEKDKGSRKSLATNSPQETIDLLKKQLEESKQQIKQLKEQNIRLTNENKKFLMQLEQIKRLNSNLKNQLQSRQYINKKQKMLLQQNRQYIQKQTPGQSPNTKKFSRTFKNNIRIVQNQPQPSKNNQGKDIISQKLLLLKNLVVKRQTHQQSLSKPDHRPNYQRLIEQAELILSKQNLPKSEFIKVEDLLKDAKEELELVQNKDNSTLDALAYVYTWIANLKYRQKAPVKQIQSFVRAALNFYNIKEESYFEEKITLLNNYALYVEGYQLKQAIELYKQVIFLQEKYYESKDIRKGLAQNNLACAFSQLKQMAQAKRHFQLGYKIAKKGSGIQALIQQNIQYYFPKEGKIMLLDLKRNKAA